MLSALVPAQDVPPRAGIPANLPNRGHFCPWPLQMLCWAIFVCDVNLGYKSERNLLPWGKKHTVQSLWKFYLWSISQNYKKVSDMRGNFRPLKIKIYSNLLFFFCPSFFPLFSCKWIRTLIFVFLLPLYWVQIYVLICVLFRNIYIKVSLLWNTVQNTIVC